MSLRSKVMGCLVLVLALFSGVSYFNYQRSKAATESVGLVNDFFIPLSRQVAQIQSNLQALADDMRRFYFADGSKGENLALARMARDLYPLVIQKKFAHAERLVSEFETAGVGDLSKRLARAKGIFESLPSLKDRSIFETSLMELRNELLAISKVVDDECQKITSAIQADARENLISSLFVSIMVLCLGGLATFLSYQVLNPLPLLIQSLKKITDGDFGQSLKVKGSTKDEVALLAREFNRMLAALKERDKKIQAQQQELLQSARLAAVGQLSAEVVHEIRNPLNSMSLNIDWLSAELEASGPEVQETLVAIATEITRLNQITESHLARARIGVNDVHLTPVNDLLREIVGFDREALEKLKVETELWPEEIFVRGDRSRLKQAFLNVIKNAKEAMPRGGTLRLKTELNQNTSRITISDSGTGMTAQVKEKSFQPFFTTKSNGTGIGLALTKEVVEEANGSIEVLSQIGSGTTFTFQFPV